MRSAWRSSPRPLAIQRQGLAGNNAAGCRSRARADQDQPLLLCAHQGRAYLSVLRGSAAAPARGHGRTRRYRQYSAGARGGFFRSQFEAWLHAQRRQRCPHRGPARDRLAQTDHRANRGEYIRMFKRLRGYLREAAERARLRPAKRPLPPARSSAPRTGCSTGCTASTHDDVLATADAAWEFSCTASMRHR
jgi:NADH:ubiquinone oxidoreductase subunit